MENCTDASGGVSTIEGTMRLVYRRSGTIMRAPFMLDSGWFEPEISSTWFRTWWLKPRKTLA